MKGCAMINIFFGNTIEGCTDGILTSLSKKESDRFAVVLAPDSYLFAFENQVAEKGFSLDVEVMSFSSLARTVLGNSIKRCLTPEGCNMIMTRAIHSIKDDLVYYKKSIARKGFVNEMYSTITALRNSGIAPADLAHGLDSMHGYVANKTKDLITIYNAYLRTLNENYSDPTTRLEALVKAMPTNQFIKETAFYIVDFYTFNHKEYEVLGELFKYAYSIDIGVIDAVGGLSPKSIYPYENTAIILELAKKSGSAVKRVNSFTALDEYQRFISNDMFGLTQTSDIEKTVDVELITPAAITDEADSVCIKIAELVRKGARYKDIGIVCGNPEDNTLETYLGDYNIPYFKDVKNPLTEEASIKYLLFALDVFANNFEVNRVMSLVKNPLSMISARDGMLFENYVEKYAINYTRFTSPFTKGEEREIEIPEKVRNKLFEQIPTLPQFATAKEYISLIKDYLISVNYQNRLECFFDRQLNGEDMLSAKRTAQIPMKLISTLNLCGELLADYTLSLNDFIDTLESSFESIKLSLIPLSADCVQIGEARDSKFEDIKYLFVVGASDGQIPKESGQGTILTHKYSTDLQLLNMVVRPQVKEENRFAKFALTQLLLKATRGLYISCPLSGASGESITKSEIFKKFADSLGISIKNTYTHDEYSEFVTKKQCLKKVATAVSCTSGELDEFNRSLLALLSLEDKDRIYALYYDRNNTLENGDIFKDKNGTTTVSKIEKFYSCPYDFFVRYGLGAKERETAEIRVNETGSFIHEVLDRFFTENLHRIDDIDYEYAQILAMKIADDLLENDDRLKGLLSEGERRIENLKTESAIITANLNELAKKSKLRPYKTEVEFGYDSEDSYPAIELSSGTKVRGKIDRIDIFENNIVVIDYKTGKVKPALNEIFFGEKIQLYIYLYALKNLGYKPIGAFYQHIDAKFSKKKDSKYAYLGQFISTPEILDIFDPEFKNNGVSEILPIKTGAKGSIVMTGDASKKDTLLTEDGFADVVEYAYKLLERADKYINDGYIEVKPIEKACTYCLSKNICMVKDGICRKKCAINIEDFYTIKDEEMDS